MIIPLWGLLMNYSPPTGNALSEAPAEVVADTGDDYIVAVQPFGEFDTALVSLACREIWEFYGTAMILMPVKPLPGMSWYAPRSRYRADSLLIWLELNKPEQACCILGLTDKDISCTKGDIADWGIFGYGYQPGPACVVSTFRLKRNASGDAHFRERFAKVVLHELGHNFGLPHCPATLCLMGDAKGTINTVDQEQKMLCPACCGRLKEKGFQPPVCK